MEIDVSMNMEDTMYSLYKEYIEENSKFSPKVFNASPKKLPQLPTITIVEQNNIEDNQYRSLDKNQYVNKITTVIEIYTQDKVIENKKYASKEIMNELKYLTFDFFRKYGCERLSCESAEYYNKEIDRLVIMYRYNVNSWNKKIS